ncbi:hypothetical protein AKJ41_06035, partial [candidate division MSBL1 archaeon SCGC-AAA259O05]
MASLLGRVSGFIFPFLKSSKACLSNRMPAAIGYTTYAIAGVLITWSTTNISLTNALIALLKISPIWFLLVESVYVFNDIFDKEIDTRNDLDRPIAKGEASSDKIMYLFILLSAIVLTLSTIINFATMLVSSTF